MNRRQLKRLRKSLLAIYDELDAAYWSNYTERMLYEAMEKLGKQIVWLDRSIRKMEKEDGDNETLS